MTYRHSSGRRHHENRARASRSLQASIAPRSSGNRCTRPSGAEPLGNGAEYESKAEARDDGGDERCVMWHHCFWYTRTSVVPRRSEAGNSQQNCVRLCAGSASSKIRTLSGQMSRAMVDGIARSRPRIHDAARSRSDDPLRAARGHPARHPVDAAHTWSEHSRQVGHFRYAFAPADGRHRLFAYTCEFVYMT